MEPNDTNNKEILEEILETTKDNNKILKRINKNMLLGRVMTVIYWLIILGIGVGSYYYIQPYIDGLFDTYSGVRGGFQGVNNFINSSVGQ